MISSKIQMMNRNPLNGYILGQKPKSIDEILKEPKALEAEKDEAKGEITKPITPPPLQKVGENPLLKELYSINRKPITLEDIEKRIEKSRQELREQIEKERELNRVIEEKKGKDKKEKRESYNESQKPRIKQAEAEALFKQAEAEGKNPPLQGSYKPGQWYANIEKIM